MHIHILVRVAITCTVHRFEQRTTEAAKLKLDVDKANETIGAAENLIGKLEGEYKRWSAQVRMYISVHMYVPSNTIFRVMRKLIWL